MLRLINFRSFTCRIKAYKTRDSDPAVLSEPQEWAELPNGMNDAKFFQTQGSCCWKLFKMKNFRGRNPSIVQPTNFIKENDFNVKSVQKAQCS